MTWPTDDLVKDQLDQQTDDPAQALAQVEALLDKTKLILAEPNYAPKPPLTTGTATVYSASTIYSAYETDRAYMVQPHLDNTGAFTADLGPGAKSVKLLNGLDPYAGAFKTGMAAILLYNGTNLVLVNPEARRVRNWGYTVASFAAPAANISAIAIDPITGNLISCDAITLLFYIHNGISGTVSSNFATPSTGPVGATVDPATGNLISCDLVSQLIYVHAGISSTISSSFASPSITPTGVAIDPATGNLISCDANTDLIYIHAGISSTISSSFAAPATVPNAITIDPATGNLISCDATANLIYIHDGISSTILNSFPAPSTYIYGMDIDPATGNLISGDTDSDLIYIHLTQHAN